jgi:hypothetical protein
MYRSQALSTLILVELCSILSTKLMVINLALLRWSHNNYFKVHVKLTCLHPTKLDTLSNNQICKETWWMKAWLLLDLFNNTLKLVPLFTEISVLWILLLLLQPKQIKWESLWYLENTLWFASLMQLSLLNRQLLLRSWKVKPMIFSAN